MQILIDGKEVDTLAGHVDLRRPLERDAIRSLRRADASNCSRVLHYSGAPMRADGRLAEQLRPTRITPNYLIHAEGSVLVEAGKTKVICTASVEDRVPPFRRNTGKGWVTAEYGMLPRATTTRTQRESTAGRVGGRTQEIQRLIGRSLRAVTQARGARRADDHARLRRHPGRRRHAHGVDHRRVRRAGARRCRRCASRTCSGRCRSPTTSPPRASASSRASRCSTWPTSRTRKADVDMNIVKTGAGLYIELQGTAEALPFGREALNRLLDLGRHRHPPADRAAARARRPVSSAK